MGDTGSLDYDGSCVIPLICPSGRQQLDLHPDPLKDPKNGPPPPPPPPIWTHYYIGETRDY